MNDTPSSRHTTLLDIARNLNISASTVSRALHNNSRISAKRRAEIQAVATQMGYRPNPMAVALGHQRHSIRPASFHSNLAWINLWGRPEELREHREFDLYFRGATQAADSSGYLLEEIVCDNRMSATRLERILRARGIHGILVPPHRNASACFDHFNWNKFSAVRFGYSLRHPALHVVSSDQLTNSFLAFEKIRKNGYRRIGFATSTLERTRFKAGFLLAQSELAVRERVPLLVFSPETHDDHAQLATWLKKHRPDAILTDISSLPDMLHSIGYRVPGDVGLATLSVLDGKVDAGIYQNSEEIGKTAVELLISLLNHNRQGIPAICRETLIGGRWVDGASLPPIVPSE